jgi:hypothetical protein
LEYRNRVWGVLRSVWGDTTPDSYVNDDVRVRGEFLAILSILHYPIHILLYYTHGTVPYAGTVL